LDEKQRVLDERLASIEAEIAELHNSSHKGFAQHCKELEEKKNARIRTVTQWKNAQYQLIEESFIKEKKQADDEYPSLQRCMILT
jgi:hypothetical protein